MPTYIALFRGLNMVGRKTVAMSDLRLLTEKIGFSEVRVLQASGNLIFKTAQEKPGVLEARLEAALAKRLGLTTSAFVRTAATWKKIVVANPFGEEATRDPGHLAVVFLKDKPAPIAVAALKKAITGRETFEVDGRTLYAYYPHGFAGSKFTTALVDRILATTCTGRSWNTVLKIARAGNPARA